MLATRADSLRERGDNTSARRLYEKMLRADPANLYAMLWLSVIHKEAGDYPRAREYCARGLAIDPDQIALLMQMGGVDIASNDPLAALDCYERVRKLDPEVPGLDALLADQHCILGRIDDGVAAFDRALAKEPDAPILQSNRLFVLNYGDLLTPEQLAEEHRQWARPHERMLAPQRAPHPARSTGHRLRIGYVSPDLREHAIAHFMEPLLAAHDRAAFDICCFNTLPANEDRVSERLRKFATEWRHVRQGGDATLAQALREAGIDIAVDLAGHTSKNRILAFARKPAPIQVSWLGYLATTGLASMDYRITDSYLDPEGMTEALHSEMLWRLPNQACFGPDPDAPEPGPLPALASGRVTFGSINQWSKVTPAMKALWARLLAEVPRSRLLVIARGVSNSRMPELIRGEFAGLGVDMRRVDISPMLPHRGFLALFGEIDLVLDTFPYGGGTTTMHALWMGVPVVTLAGRTPMSRNAIGPLTEVGLARLVAGTRDEYVAIAAALARDLPALAAIRTTLRAKMAASPLVDAKRFARQMEDAYRSMWRNYAAQH